MSQGVGLAELGYAGGGAVYLVPLVAEMIGEGADASIPAHSQGDVNDLSVLGVGEGFDA